jgi:signal transduction histidine kinase
MGDGAMTHGRPITIVTVLVLLLTYLLIQSRSPAQPARTRAHQALQALQLHDSTLNHAVLMTRAGLLLNYDSVAAARNGLAHDLDVLTTQTQTLEQHGEPLIARQTRTLVDSVSRKQRLVEDFISDNAVLRNSITYSASLGQSVDQKVAVPGRRQHAIRAANALMRFVQAPESTAHRQVEAAVAALHRAGLDAETTAPLAAHARVILDLLPRVDQELRSVIAMPVATEVETLQRTLLQSSNVAEARAQRFRLLLYASALVLLVYLVYLVARLRGNALELRRKESQLIQANKMTALGVLVSSVAHEINNPNQVVLTNSNLVATAWADVADVLDGSGDDAIPNTVAGLPYTEMRETVPRLIRDAEESARRIDAIVGDLKSFARPSGLVTEFFQLNDVVQRVMRLLAHFIRKRTDAFRVQLDDALPLLRGNPQQVEQVAVNLVMNALESLPSRHAGVTVTTSQDVKAREVVLAVRDEGVGMPREHVARLGEAFFTTKSATGGTGLGIAIASSLVKLNRGHLSFISQSGRGTCATLRLPVAGNTRESITRGAA